jgi:hypothetical protein
MYHVGLQASLRKAFEAAIEAMIAAEHSEHSDSDGNESRYHDGRAAAFLEAVSIVVGAPDPTMDPRWAVSAPNRPTFTLSEGSGIGTETSARRIAALILADVDPESISVVRI